MKVWKITAQRAQLNEDEVQGDAFGGLLGSYRHDGHVLGRELMTVSLEGRLETFVFVPADDAFEVTTDNEWIHKSREEVKAAGLAEPEYDYVGDDPSELDGCICAYASSLVLFTTYIQIQSPVRCGDCFRPVPLYHLPRFKNNSFTDVISWADDWKACDSLFMNSATGERFGYREMSQPNSSLSRRGRAICAHLEQGTGKPAFYYLHRYYGRSRATEEGRKCPGCGGDWRLSKKWHTLFDFKCDQCRLVSSLSSAVV